METKHCIVCDEAIDIKAKFCPFCTAKQPDIEFSETKHAEKKEKKAETKMADIEYPKRRDINDVVVIESPQQEKSSEEKLHQEKVEKERKEQSTEEKRIKYLAYHDELTHIGNRQAYKEKLDTMSQKEACIGAIDANNLKKINDSMGHKYGDILLVTIAEGLSTIFGEENVFRVGGDEFAVLLEGERSAAIDSKIEEFRMFLEEEMEHRGNDFEISASVGFAYGDGIKSIRDIVDEADSQMYLAKKDYKEKESDIEETKKIKSEMPFLNGVYDPNADGYYDDVKVLEEVEDNKLSNEVILKMVGIVVGGIFFIIIYLLII